MFALRLFKKFGQVKPKPLMVITGMSTENGMKINSKTDNSSYQITNPGEALLGSLVACQAQAVKELTKETRFKVNKINFNKIQSSYDFDNFQKGGKDNHMDDVTIQAQLETNGTPDDVDELHGKVLKNSPIYNLLINSGVKINSKWTNLNKKQ